MINLKSLGTLIIFENEVFESFGSGPFTAVVGMSFPSLSGPNAAEAAAISIRKRPMNCTAEVDNYSHVETFFG